MTPTELLQIFTGCIGSLGFGFLFNVRGKRLCVATLGGLLAWLIFLLLGRFVDSEPLRYLIVSFCLSVYAEIMARVMKTPATIVTISLIPLIPGGSLYYTMAYAFQSDGTRFVSKAVYTLQLAAALAIGIIAATALVPLCYNLIKRGVCHDRKQKRTDTGR